MSSFFINLLSQIEYIPAISTFAFLYVYYEKLNSKFALIILLTFFSSLSHHIFPENNFVRLLDWGLAITLAILLISKINSINSIIFLLIVAAILSWLFSLIFFHYLHMNTFYEFTHSTWHLLSAYLLFIIF